MVGQFAFEAFKSTVGSKGMAGFVSQLGKTTRLPFTLAGVKGQIEANLAKSKQAGVIDRIVEQANQEKDPVKKENLLAQAFVS